MPENGFGAGHMEIACHYSDFSETQTNARINVKQDNTQ